MYFVCFLLCSITDNTGLTFGTRKKMLMVVHASYFRSRLLINSVWSLKGFESKSHYYCHTLPVPHLGQYYYYYHVWRRHEHTHCKQKPYCFREKSARSVSQTSLLCSGNLPPFHAVKTLHVNLFIDTILPVSIIYPTVLEERSVFCQTAEWSIQDVYCLACHKHWLIDDLTEAPLWYI